MCCQETVAYDLYYLAERRWYTGGLLFRGGFTFKPQLGDHIQAYTKRSLTFQTDALFAMGDVFRAFATMPSPIRTFWGIPMDYNVIPPTPNFFNTKRNNIHSTKDKSTTNWLETLFERGLCWTLEKAASRRPDFPSWSWAGWIGPTAQFPWKALSLRPINSEIDIRFQRSNGTFEKMSETLITEVDRQGLSLACFTQILRIHAWASEVSFEYFPLGITGQKPHVRADGSEPRYYTTFEFSATSSESGKPTYGYWPLTLTTESRC